MCCQFGKGRELEQPNQVFHLIKMGGFPAFGNAVVRQVNLDQAETKVVIHKTSYGGNGDGEE